MNRRARDIQGRGLRRRCREEGQALVVVAICLVGLLGATGLVIDVGRIYTAQRELQVAADAAALAGAADLPNGATAMTTACTYGATDHGAGSCNGSGLGADGNNSVASLTSVKTTTQLECLSVASAGIACVNAPGCADPAGYPPRGSGANLGCNAIKVTEKATVGLSFMNVVGIGSWDVTAASTASMAGGIPQPLDIEMALDSTRSMADSDSCGPNGVLGIPSGDTTAEDCAKAGARAFLGALYPCDQSLASCGTAVNGNNPAPLDEVGLMTFPALKSLGTGAGTGVPAETDCVSNVTGSNVTYTLNSNFFTSGGTPYSNYQVVPFSSDYRTSSATGTPLSNSSNLVNAVDWGNCPGGVYPVNGGQGGSIGGGAANDRSTAVTSNGAVAITGGPAAAGDRSTATNGGAAAITGGPATAGNRSTDSNGGSATIAGGPGIAGNRSTWTVTGQTSIPVPVPANETAGSLVLVSITTLGLHNGDRVCPPGPTWSEVPGLDSSGTSNSNRISVTTFESVRPGPGKDGQPYSFGFARSGGTCPSPAGGMRSVNASAMAVVYTGVDPTDPVDASPAANDSNGSNNSGTVTASAVTTNYAGDRVVRVYGAGSSGFNGGAPGVPAGQSVASGGTLLGVADGSQTTATTATTSTNSFWVADSIALQPQQGATSISVPVPANEAAGDLMVVSVAARGLGANAAICAPDSSWQKQPVEESQPNGGGATSMTLATFESARGADSQPYVFTFSGDGSCSASSLVSVSASAMAVRYTGVDPSSPVDDSNPNRGTGATLTSPGVTTSSAGDRVVRVYASGTNAFTSGVPAGQSVGNGTVALLGISDGAGTGTAQAKIGSSDNWVADSIALQPQQGATSISVPRPNGAANGDLLLVAVTVKGLPANGSICAPTDINHPWSLIQQDGGANSITQATFYSFRGAPAGDAGPYAFNFTAGPTCTGGSALVQGTALVIRYTGVAPVLPIDAKNGAQGSNIHPAPPSVSTNNPNEMVVRFYGTAAGSISGDSQTVSGSGTSTGYNDGLQAGLGATGSGTAITTASADWAADTIALKAQSSGCASNCFYGVEDPGGVGTYYAGVISEAQNALVAHSRPANKVIILLSDGDATATGVGSGECIQAVKAAEAAAKAGTWVFSIAYNSQSSGCATDTNPTISPICAMHLIADNPESDPTIAAQNIADNDWTWLKAHVCNSTLSDPQHRFYNEPSGSSLDGIFTSIGVTLASQRLVSNDAS